MPTDVLDGKLRSLPVEPGVYRFLDAGEKVIYVGKAKSLRKRVRQYFQKRHEELKTRQLVAHIADVDVIVTGSELEALLLESNLIKKHRPKYNITLKDNRRYPYIEITAGETFPRVRSTRVRRRGKSLYFGPYVNLGNMHETMDLLQTVFPLRQCKTIQSRHRPCLNYHLGRCAAPCAGMIAPDAYRAMIDQVAAVLQGNNTAFLAGLQEEMERCSRDFDYEAAARVRDRINAVRQIAEKQNVYLAGETDSDVFVMRTRGPYVGIVVLTIRGGKLTGKVETADEIADSATDAFEQFFEQYYLEGHELPREVWLSVIGSNPALLGQWLEARFKRSIQVKVPRKGTNKRLVEMAEKNADFLLTEYAAQQFNEQEAVRQMKSLLRLDHLPRVIECFDISNIQGRQAVASMVSFVDGLPDTSRYRRFRIRGEQSPNDPAMMREALTRRYRRLREAARAASPGQSVMPDLVMVDGGAAQLNAAVGALRDLDVSLPVISLAKREEMVYSTTLMAPVVPERTGIVSLLLQRLRDEAHRFAITYHRQLRRREETASEFSLIPGVGRERGKALQKEFKTMDKLSHASWEDVRRVKGVSEKLAGTIYGYFHDGHADDSM